MSRWLAIAPLLAACGGLDPQLPSPQPAKTDGCSLTGTTAQAAACLDDPKQKPDAVKKLIGDFENAVTRSNGEKTPEVKAVLDVVVPALTRVYPTLDRTQSLAAMRVLAGSLDARATPAFGRAIADHATRPDDAALACIAIARIQKVDKGIADALWDALVKTRASQNPPLPFLQALHDALIAVKDPSYGPKAAALLDKPLPEDEAERRDHLDLWQPMAAQLIGELKYTEGVTSLVKAVGEKGPLAGTLKNALAQMPKEAEPLLIDLLKNSKGDQAFGAAMALGRLSRPAGLAATLELLPKSEGVARLGMALALPLFPHDAKTVAAFKAAYPKIAQDKSLAGPQDLRPRLLEVSAQFFDPSLVEFLLKVSESSKENAAKLAPFDPAMKLMKPAQRKQVREALKRLEGDVHMIALGATALPLNMAERLMEKCVEKLDCYLAVLDTQIPAAQPPANTEALKAIWMAAILGDASTRDELLKRIGNVRDPLCREAVALAIDHLSPQGDVALADRLEKQVTEDVIKDPQLAVLDEPLAVLSLKLRSRAAK
jgi:hypothetical protein